jgi:hypothetical protein
MSEDTFNNDTSRRLNKTDIANIFHSMQEDFSMLVAENMKDASRVLDKEVIDYMIKMADVIDKHLLNSEEFYALMDSSETVSTNSFIRFLHSMEKELGEKLAEFPEVVVFGSAKGENITTRNFFLIFIKIIIVLKISILLGESFEEQMDNELLQQEYERMKREGLI